VPNDTRDRQARSHDIPAREKEQQLHCRSFVPLFDTATRRTIALSSNLAWETRCAGIIPRQSARWGPCTNRARYRGVGRARLAASSAHAGSADSRRDRCCPRRWRDSATARRGL